MANEQFFHTTDRAPLRKLLVTFPNHVPHWKAYGEGHAYIEFLTHDEAKWVSIDTYEQNAEGTAMMRTMVTLDEKSGRALYARLKALYEEAPDDQPWMGG